MSYASHGGQQKQRGFDLRRKIMRALIEDDRRTIRELVAICGASSTSVVANHLDILASEGLIVLGTGARAIRLTDATRADVPGSDAELLARCLDALTPGGEPSLVADLRRRLGRS